MSETDVILSAMQRMESNLRSDIKGVHHRVDTIDRDGCSFGRINRERIEQPRRTLSGAQLFVSILSGVAAVIAVIVAVVK